MAVVVFITHPEVVIDPLVPVPDWALSPKGLERMEAFCGHDFVGRISRVFASAERKARDGAEVIAAHLGLDVEIDADLGENDRSSTGYLPQAEFVAVARQFFAEADRSIRGWERAVDAQRRIVSAVDRIAARNIDDTIAMVSHGGVGTLLMCHLRGHPISLQLKPPAPEGGCAFAFETRSGEIIANWVRVEEPLMLP